MSKKSKGKKPRVKREGTVTEFVQPLILAGESVEQIVSKAKARFPKSKFKATHVYWHRQHLKSDGAKVPALVRANGGAPKKRAKKKAGKKKAATKRASPRKSAAAEGAQAAL